VELPHETAPAGGFTPAHTHRDRTSCAFKTAPVVTVFCRFQRDVVDRQLRVTTKNGSDHVLIPNSSEVHAIRGTNFFQCFQTCQCVCGGCAVGHAARVQHQATFDAEGSYKLFQVIPETDGFGQQSAAVVRFTDICTVARLFATADEQVPWKRWHDNHLSLLTQRENCCSVFQNPFVSR
jgi:hypothetical protein